MDAQGGHIDFMFLGPPYPATGSATGQTCKFVNSTLLGPEGPYKLIGRIKNLIHAFSAVPLIVKCATAHALCT